MRGTVTRDDAHKQFVVWDTLYGKRLPGDKHARIVDIGCGNGELVHWLRERGYANAIGVDANKELLEEGKVLGVDGLIAQDIFLFLKGKRDAFDCIIVRDVIEHFTKDELLLLLDLVYEALRPGGIIILQTPNAEGPFGSRYRYQDFTHELGFTRTSLYHVLRTAGFSEVLIYPLQPVVHGVKSFVRFVLWKCIEGSLRLYHLVEIGSGEGIFTQNIIAVGKK